MLYHYVGESIERVLREETADFPFPPASNRAAWQTVRDSIDSADYNQIMPRQRH